MKKNFFLIIIVILSFPAFAQRVISIQPNAKKGKDAFIFNLESQEGRFGATNTTNYGNSKGLPSMEWTWDGDDGTIKSLIQFDLFKIPENSKIKSAYLSLYFNVKEEGEMKENHSTLSGSNESWIEKITSDWDENTVTWNNQPTVSKNNRILLPTSKSETENYENIDITDLVQEMIKNPNENFGFMISMKRKTHYRRLMFASSDHKNKRSHPKLVITYEKNNSEALKENSDVSGKEPTETDCKKLLLLIFDSNNNLISRTQEIDIIDLNTIIFNLDEGDYIFQLIDEKQNITSFEIKK